MKSILLIGCISIIGITSTAQTADEKQIKELEQRELLALQKGDTTTLKTIWSKDFVVHNPMRQIVTIDQVFQRIKEGKIDYSTAERFVEKISFIENVAVSMGTELITPQNESDFAGKKVTRQYTNVWLRTKKGWRMIARQASIVSAQ